MNRFIAITLVLAFAFSSVPAVQAQGAGAVFEDNFATDKGWTVSNGETNLPPTTWTKVLEGADSAWYAGAIAADEKLGYNVLADTTLISPVIELGELNLESVQYDLQGGSEAGWDFLRVSVVPAGGGAIEVAQHSGSQADFETVKHHAAAADTDPLAQISGGSIQIHFRFTADATCAAFDAPANPLCADEDYLGWMVDNVVVTAVEAALPPPPPPASSGDAGNIAPHINSFTRTKQSIDLVANAGETIDFTVTAQDDRRLVVTTVYLQNAAHDITIRAPLKQTSVQTGAGHQTETWSGSLAVNTQELRTGTWSVTALVFDQQGGVNNSAHLNVADLVVTATGASSPSISVVGTTGPQTVMGSGSSLRFVPSSQILHRVTYQMVFPSGSVSPEFTLQSPYIINPESLPLGEMQIIAKAYDRAGRDGLISVSVLVDTAPPVLAATPPTAAYQNVPFVLAVATKDLSEHTLTASYRDVVKNFVVAKGAHTHSVSANINETGLVLFSLRVVDQAGNVATLTKEVTVVRAIADIVVGDATVLTPRALPGQPIRLKVDVSQTDGVAALPVTTTVNVGSVMMNATNQVGINGSASNTFERVFAPGQYTANVTAATIDSVNETDATNNHKDVAFEVFLGKVSIGATDYYVRASAQGLPVEMVGPDDETYVLSVDSDYDGTRYKFTVGGTDYYWDPLDTDNSFPEEPTKKKTPAGAMIPLLAMLGAALLARRK